VSTVIASVFVHALTAYAAIGLVFGVLFVTKGVTRLDPAARGASLGFRLIILPGVVALWPVLAQRWRAGRGVAERNPHRDAAGRGW
jgi:hypothetical protein